MLAHLFWSLCAKFFRVIKAEAGQESQAVISYPHVSYFFDSSPYNYATDVANLFLGILERKWHQPGWVDLTDWQLVLSLLG